MYEKQIASLSLVCDSKLVVMTKPLVRSAAESVSLSSEDSAALGDVVEEIIEKLVEIDSADGDEQSICVTLLHRTHEFVIVLEHKGLPIDIERGLAANRSPFSISVNSHIIDNIRLINLGKLGQKLELSKLIPHDPISSFVIGETKKTPDDQSVAPQKVPRPEIRLIDPSEGIRLARCFFRAYGFTYGGSYVYNPDLLKTLVMDGRLISAVAVDSTGEFCAHAAISLNEPNSPIGELVSLAVHPEYRKSGLAKRIHLYLVKEARKRKMQGLFAEAVTIHPYSQRLCLDMLGKESAVMVGYIPPSTFRKISERSETKRQMAIVYFFVLSKKDKKKTVFAPSQHAPMVEKIYSHLNLNRISGHKTTGTIDVLCGNTAFDLKVKRDMKIAAFSVHLYCPDTVELVRAKLGELLASGIEYVYLDLPLFNSLTPYFAEEFESMGFFFSGVLPYLNDGDSLRLQFLNSSEVDLDSAEVVSQFGAKISDYVKMTKIKVPITNAQSSN